MIERHLVECFFSKIKEYRRVATRYEKLAQIFLSFVYLAASVIWIRQFANTPWGLFLKSLALPARLFHESRMRRYHISDAQWKRFEPLLCPARQERRGRLSKDARLMFDGVLWILRTGAPWRDLPDEFGPWQTVCKRFNMWAKSSIRESILSNFAENADFEGL